MAETSKGSQVLAVEKITKSYEGEKVLDEVSLSIAKGTIVALVGTNGSGKTTLVKTIAGLVTPDSGRIDILGSTAGSRQARAVTSIVFDDPALYPDLTVREHLGFSARICGREDYAERADELLGGFGISDLAARLPQGFSRGQRQKTSLSMGLVRPFRLLVLDEPYVGLDGAGKTALVGFIRQARSEGAAILVATHSPELLEIADTMIALGFGKVVYQGKPDRAKLEL